ncbi:MAG: FAD-binding protein [Nitrospinota bacterium]|jgi:succinate dehydrogenase/fumarate reductase flavoprotein subunit|nr:FAD-binding protein [Nitrospinota bacterium]
MQSWAISEKIHCDVLVIGSGAAGLRAAIEATRQGRNVLIACKSNGGRGTSTHIANGGFRVAHEDFTREEHFELVMKGGRFINDRRKVRILANEAPAAYEEMKRLGVTFRREGAMPAFPGGKAIIHALEKEASHLGVKTLKSTAIVELLRDGDRVCGAIAYDAGAGAFKALLAPATILATGGAGALYSFCDNPPHATGDGYYLGLAAGARLTGMEFVQFYPLGAYQPERTALLFPPVLGNLGVIRNAEGEDIYQKHGITAWPAASLARDVTSRALYSEIDCGAGVGGALLLDLREMTEEDWASSPGVQEKRPYFRRRFNCDEEPLRIIPVSHYTMGGIVIDDWGGTGVEGLFAAGEATGGTHGANRIGGNAIPEALIFGARAGQTASQLSESSGGGTFPSESVISDAMDRWRETFFEKGGESAEDILDGVRSEVWENVGIIREGDRLRSALESFDALERDRLPRLLTSTPREIIAALEARSLLLIAQMAASSALLREESRGAHYRSDFPEEAEDGMFNTLVRFDGGKFDFEKIEVLATGGAENG